MDKPEKASLIKRFVLLPPAKKDFILLCLFYVVIFVLLTPLFFLRHSEWPLGWLLGAGVSVFAYWSISKIPSLLLGKDSQGLTLSSIVLMGGRLFLYAASLVISAICTFRPEWFGGWNLLSFWAVVIAIIPMPFLVILSSLHETKKDPAITTVTPVEEKKATPKEPTSPEDKAQ
jgi:hypothetical protein